MHNTKFTRNAAISLGTPFSTFQAGYAMAAPANEKFFDAALCKPPYTTASATAVYEAAEALAKPDTSALGAAIYKISSQIGRAGFKSDEVFVGGTAVGVLIEGLRADDLAAKYGVKPESSDMLGTSSKSYAHELPADQQPEPGLTGPGKVFIVAREGDALPGKTLLACEFVQDF